MKTNCAYDNETGLPMTCAVDDCSKDAVCRYTWPGADEQGLCEEHEIDMLSKAAMMNIHVQTISLGDRRAMCTCRPETAIAKDGVIQARTLMGQSDGTKRCSWCGKKAE